MAPLGSGVLQIPEACSVMSNTQQKPWDSAKRIIQQSPVVGSHPVIAWPDLRQTHNGAGVLSTERK